MFDPNENKPDDNGGGDYHNLTKALKGAVLGLERIIKHDETKNGKLFTQFRVEVVWAQDKSVIGATFLERMYRSPSSYKALGAWCAAAGVTEKFNPADDADIERLFLGRALWASTKVKNGYAEMGWRTSRDVIIADGAPHGRDRGGDPVVVDAEKVIGAMEKWEAAYELADHGSDGGGHGGGDGGGHNPDDFSDDDDFDFG